MTSAWRPDVVRAIRWIAASTLVAGVLACVPVQARAAIPVPQPSTYLAAPLSQADINRFVADLAAAGVGVYDPATSRPLRAVRAPGPVRLTSEQAQAAAVGVSAHAGLSGATLDRLVPRMRFGRLKVGLAAIVAGWARHVHSRPASLARRILGTPVWARYRTLVFPYAVLLLFAADTVAHLRHGRSVTARTALSSPCTTAENFAIDAIDRFFNAIGHVSLGSDVDALFGSAFLGQVFNGMRNLLATSINAIPDAAHRILVAGVRVPEQLIAQSIASVATVVTVVGTVATALVPWSARITGTPNPTAKGIGVGVPGTFALDVTAPGAVLWPPALADCAAHFGLTLPDLAPKNADVKWDVVSQHPGDLIQPGARSSTLDDHGHAQLSFVTTTETPEQATGHPAIGAVVTVARIHRRDLDQLRDRLTSDLLRAIPSFVRDLIGSQLRSVLAPMINAATKKITDVQDIEVAGVEAVRFHEPPENNRKPPRKPPATELHYGLVDPCSLLTFDDLAAVFGLAPGGHHDGPARGLATLAYSECTWGLTAPGDDYENLVSVETSMYRSVATAKIAFNVATRTFKPVAIGGLGDQATHLTTGLRAVYVRKDNLVIVVEPGALPVEQLVGFARRALSRLPAPARIVVPGDSHRSAQQ